MKKTILLNLFLLLITNTMFSQDIFKEIAKYNITVLEKKIIEKTRKQLNIDKYENLYSFPVFSIELKKDFSIKSVTNQEFMNNIKLFNKRVMFFVYNDSLNVFTLTSNNDKQIIPVFKSERSKEYLFVKYYIEKKPNYLFELVFHQLDVILYSPCYISYKDGEVELVYLEHKSEKLMVIPLSKVEDVRVLNPFRFDK